MPDGLVCAFGRAGLVSGGTLVVTLGDGEQLAPALPSCALAGRCLSCAARMTDSVNGSAWRTSRPMPTMRAAIRSTDPHVESPREAYLRRVIERQPVCLTRIAFDGTF